MTEKTLCVQICWAIFYFDPTKDVKTKLFCRHSSGLTSHLPAGVYRCTLWHHWWVWPQVRQSSPLKTPSFHFQPERTAKQDVCPVIVHVVTEDFRVHTRLGHRFAFISVVLCFTSYCKLHFIVFGVFFGCCVTVLMSHNQLPVWGQIKFYFKLGKNSVCF